MSTMKNRKLETREWWALAVAGVALVAVLAGSVLATPSSGIVSAAVLARGGFVYPVDLLLKFKPPGERQEVIHVRDARQTVMQQIVIAPGGTTGWHSHPGPVVVLVKAGELTLYSADDPACAPRTYTAEQSFIDTGQGHAHIAFNTAEENTELLVTYFDVPAGMPFRLDAPDPGHCGF